MEVRIRKLTGLRAGPTVGRRFVKAIQSLVAAKPGAPAARRNAAELEHTLLRLLTGGGLADAERTVTALKQRGPAVILAEKGKGRRGWTWLSDDRRRELTIRVWASRSLRMTSVRWHELRVIPALSARQGARDERHQAFYAAYESIAAKAYGLKPPRLNARDKTILLIGELEADVNNGGFGQYVSNKGRARAGAALRALRSVGAKRAAAMLEAALTSGISEGELSRLDERFYRGYGDLAGLTVRATTRST